MPPPARKRRLHGLGDNEQHVRPQIQERSCSGTKEVHNAKCWHGERSRARVRYILFFTITCALQRATRVISARMNASE